MYCTSESCLTGFDTFLCWNVPYLYKIGHTIMSNCLFLHSIFELCRHRIYMAKIPFTFVLHCVHTALAKFTEQKSELAHSFPQHASVLLYIVSSIVFSVAGTAQTLPLWVSNLLNSLPKTIKRSRKVCRNCVCCDGANPCVYNYPSAPPLRAPRAFP